MFLCARLFYFIFNYIMQSKLQFMFCIFLMRGLISGRRTIQYRLSSFCSCVPEVIYLTFEILIRRKKGRNVQGLCCRVHSTLHELCASSISSFLRLGWNRFYCLIIIFFQVSFGFFLRYSRQPLCSCAMDIKRRLKFKTVQDNKHSFVCV